jgi:hypothetical protein
VKIEADAVPAALFEGLINDVFIFIEVTSPARGDRSTETIFGEDLAEIVRTCVKNAAGVGLLDELEKKAKKRAEQWSALREEELDLEHVKKGLEGALGDVEILHSAVMRARRQGDAVLAPQNRKRKIEAVERQVGEVEAIVKRMKRD